MLPVKERLEKKEPQVLQAEPLQLVLVQLIVVLLLLLEQLKLLAQEQAVLPELGLAVLQELLELAEMLLVPQKPQVQAELLVVLDDVGLEAS